MRRLLFILFTMLSALAQASSSEEYLRRADAIRNPDQQYQMTVTIKAEETESQLRVFLSGTDKTLIVTVSPAHDLGRNMLMLDRDFYVYVPSLKRSVRLSLSQKLSGQVANGDVARTRWYADYKVLSATVKGKEIELYLDGKKANLTYQKIRLWLEAGSAKPLRAQYLTTNGAKVLKTAYFEAYRQMAGALRPTQIRLVDAAGKTSSLLITSMERAKFKEQFFTEKNMELQR